MIKQKSILIINSHIPWGGLGQFTLSLARGLDSEGYEVHGLVTHSNEDNFEQMYIYLMFLQVDLFGD